MDESLSVDISPGLVVLFGSGETSPSGRKVFETILRDLPQSPRISLLETPAGFELNSSQVIGRVGEFISHRLQNYQPRLSYIQARRRGTPYSPDDPEIVDPLYYADMIFMGPGSPSYAVRQLRESLAWHAILARHRLGAALALASAAVIAISAYALPVYEIYKVGEDLHWKEGLNLFGHFGLPLVFIPHWNNNDGGEELDTSRCFMGQPRFASMMEMLPADLTVVGIDEKTALVVNPKSGSCQVVGLGGVTLIHTGQAHPDSTGNPDLQGTGLAEIAHQRKGHVHRFDSGQTFSFNRIGALQKPKIGADLPDQVWQRALQAQKEPAEERTGPPEIVLELVREREIARQQKDWSTADRLRDKIAELGWLVQDTPEGSLMEEI
jgi:hypothetical protein